MHILTDLFSLLQAIPSRILPLIYNRIANTPLSIFFEMGKYFAFVTAIITDIVQMIIIHNVLNVTALSKKLGWSINEKLFKNYKKPEFLSKLSDSWKYVGVLSLSLLPVYFGGLFAAIFTAHILKLEKTKSYIFISIGSILGCFIWTIGAWNVVASVIKAGF